MLERSGAQLLSPKENAFLPQNQLLWKSLIIALNVGKSI
jgi:hypothetical protein